MILALWLDCAEDERDEISWPSPLISLRRFSQEHHTSTEGIKAKSTSGSLRSAGPTVEDTVHSLGQF